MLEVKNMDGKTTSKEGYNIVLTSRSKSLRQQTVIGYSPTQMTSQRITLIKL